MMKINDTGQGGGNKSHSNLLILRKHIGAFRPKARQIMCTSRSQRKGC